MPFCLFFHNHVPLSTTLDLSRLLSSTMSCRVLHTARRVLPCHFPILHAASRVFPSYLPLHFFLKLLKSSCSAQAFVQSPSCQGLRISGTFFPKVLVLTHSDCDHFALFSFSGELASEVLNSLSIEFLYGVSAYTCRTVIASTLTFSQSRIAMNSSEPPGLGYIAFFNDLSRT